MQNYSTENSHASGSSGAFFTGLLVGGLLGAGSMLLLAPQSGKDTREQIQEEGITLRDQVTETVEGAVKQARGTSRHMAADLRKEGKQLQKRGRAALKDQVEIASQFVEDEKKAVKDL
ncbi:MAG: YtxH domain-containing protein [Anaerolineae bacterium]